MADKLERIYTIPLREAYEAVRNKRAGKAVKLLRKFAGRHMKAEEEDVLLSMALNEYLWKRSIQKPPRKVKVRLIKEDGKVKAYLADEKIEEPKKDEKKKPEVKKDEKKPEAKNEKPEEKKTDEKKPEEKKTEELKKEQVKRSEQARAEKEAKKGMADEKEKIERAEKQKFSHGKDLASKTG